MKLRNKLRGNIVMNFNFYQNYEMLISDNVPSESVSATSIWKQTKKLQLL